MKIKFSDFLNKNKNVVDSIIESGIFNFNIGSSNTRIKNPNEEDIKNVINDIVTHNFFDWEFYFNVSDYSENYKESFEKELKSELTKDIEKFFNDWMVVSWETKYYKRDYDTWEIDINKKEDIRSVINNHFKNSKIMSQDIKDKYNLYRWVYAGEKIDQENYEYLGEYPNNSIKRKII